MSTTNGLPAIKDETAVFVGVCNLLDYRLDRIDAVQTANDALVAEIRERLARAETVTALLIRPAR